VASANAQGFYYSKPLAAGQATDFLRLKQKESHPAGETAQLLLPAGLKP